MPITTTSVKIPGDILQKLERLARKSGVTRHRYILSLLRQAVTKSK